MKIGAFEAKTQLSKLLERVRRGELITITRHGTPVARLVPAESTPSIDVKTASREFREHPSLTPIFHS